MFSLSERHFRLLQYTLSSFMYISKLGVYALSFQLILFGILLPPVGCTQIYAGVELSGIRYSAVVRRCSTVLGRWSKAE